jgi:hypothetical protein
MLGRGSGCAGSFHKRAQARARIAGTGRGGRSVVDGRTLGTRGGKSHGQEQTKRAPRKRPCQRGAPWKAHVSRRRGQAAYGNLRR